MTEQKNPTTFARRPVWALALLVLVLVAVPVAWRVFSGQKSDRLSSRPLKVGIATWPGFGPGFVAKEKGFFGPLQVEFFILDDFSARQAAFSSGQTQATISTLDSWAYEAAHGVQGRAVMVLDESFGADAIVAKPEIRTAADLAGKTVAFTKGSPSHFFLMVYLSKAGLSLKDVKTIEVDDPGRAGEAFASGSVAGAATWEPNVSQIVESGKGHVLTSTRQAPGLIVDVMVVAPQVLTEREGDVQQFVDGWLRAVSYIEEHPQDAYPIMARGLKIPPAEFPKMVEGLRYANRPVNGKWMVQDQGQAAIGLFDQAVSMWKSAGLIEQSPMGRDYVTNKFVRPRP